MNSSRRINSIAIFTAFISSLALAQDDLPNKLFDLMQLQGFYEVGNRKLFKSNYNNLYKHFDYFIEDMRKDTTFAESMFASEKDFLAQADQKSRYCSAPPSFRDPKEHTQKKFNKIYFQFIKEHYELIKNNHSQELERMPDSQRFFELMLKVDLVAKEMFSQIIEAMDKEHPGFKQIMYGKHRELTVISKIVRYEKTDDPERWGTTAHFDKSGLSLIWDSNDDDNDSLLICEDTLNPSVEELIKPARKYSHKRGVTSVILIPGLACSKVGINLKATLHGVAPLQKEYRYAVISFALIPDLDMSDLIADFNQLAAKAAAKYNNK